jgi:serine kinase of HPr protein (carbohydrate metabolism regulator)
VSAPAHIQLHASCVALGQTGVLLRGPSGAGKSDLALRLIERGAVLVADDRVDLRRVGHALVASAPAPLAGLIEARGLGIVRVGWRPEIELGLVVNLVPAAAVERLPEPARERLLGVALPRLVLDAFAASTPAKIALALDPGAILALDTSASAA